MGLAQSCLEEVIHCRFQNTGLKIATIAFIHTHGRSGTYNPHLHVILAEGAFDPNGFYAHPDNEEKVPTKSYKGLINYLTKYLASPPIGVSRIIKYDGKSVSYYYQSLQTKSTAYETIGVERFIGRMVQHILPKVFQRVGYFGLQATASFKERYEVITRVAGDLVDAMLNYVNRIAYPVLFEEIAGRNPLKCRTCGDGMELIQLFHPSRGFFYDLFAD